MARTRAYVFLLLMILIAVIVWLFISYSHNELVANTLDIELKNGRKGYEVAGTSRKWSYGFTDVGGSGKSQTAKHISILTINIWNSQFKMKERMKAIGKIIKHLKPNVISLNEVTRENLALLGSQSWFGKYTLLPSGDIFQTMPADLNEEDIHTVAVLTNLPVKKWKIYPFARSPSGRKLLKVDLQVEVRATSYPSGPGARKSGMRTIPFTVGATHLEWKKERAKKREWQLNKSVQILSSLRNACIMGDMNVRQADDGEIILPEPWHDAWLSVPGNTHENGYTWDIRKNSMNKRKTSRDGRFDRVLCKLADLNVESMKIVGKEPLAPGVYPSDHLGLFTVLVSHEADKSLKTLTRVDGRVVFQRSSN